MTTLTLCADDYGLAPGVSHAIRDLIGRGRLHATGCMTGSSHWPAEAPALADLADRTDIGLHLTLTDQVPLGPMPRLAPTGRLPSMPAFFSAALLRRINRKEIADELERQMDAFERAVGRPPDFLDGHHHVHQLPIVRDVAIDLWRRRMGGKGWVRSCWEPPLAILRRGIDPVRAGAISELGRCFRHRLKRLGIPHNRSFRGVYDLSDRIAYETLIAGFIDRAGPATLVMCHPGLVDDALIAADSLTTRREAEYRFLVSDECGRLLDRQGVRLERLAPL